ncbi:hypothetical protein D3C99_02870 [Vibrio cholerae]|nr:hypothetical protein [Vibrio cholerae]
MRAEVYTPRGAKTKRSDRPDWAPYRSTTPMSYSLRPEQIEFVRESGGSKFIRSLIDEEMREKTKDSQKSQKLIDEVMK